MSSRPLVSVIIPAHNRPDLLRECLDSVATQTWPHVEVIVADDCSSEPIEPVVRAVAWPESVTARYLRLDRNRGPGGAREAGRLVAQGTYIAYLDSDDLWKPGFLEAHITNLQAHPEADCSYCGYEIFGAYTRERDYRGFRDGAIHKFLPETFWSGNWVTNSTRVWTKRATDLIGPWAETKRSQDVNYALRAGCFDFQVVPVPAVLARYREAHGQEQLTQKPGNEGKIEAARAFLHAYEVLEAHGKLRDRANALPFAHLLFEQAIALLLANEAAWGDRCLRVAGKLAPFGTWVDGAILGTTLARKLSDAVVAGKVARRLNQSIVKKLSAYHR